MVKKKNNVILIILVVISIFLIRQKISPQALSGLPQVQNNQGSFPYYASTWNNVLLSQTFIPIDSFSITGIKLTLEKLGSPGDSTIAIRATDVNGRPTGSNLVYASIPESAISDRTIVEIEMTPITLNSGNLYAFVIETPNGDTSNKLLIYQNNGVYSGGTYYSSTNSGVTWNADYPTYDSFFEIFGDTATCIPSCSGKVCGTDGCGGSCGSCSAGNSCIGGSCFLTKNPLVLRDITDASASGITGFGMYPTGSLLRLFIVGDDNPPYEVFGTVDSFGFIDETALSYNDKLVVTVYDTSQSLNFNYAYVLIDYDLISNFKIYFPDGLNDFDSFYVATTGETYYDSLLTQDACTLANGCAERVMPSCLIPGDTPPVCNGVDRVELGQAIVNWLAGIMSRNDLGQAIQSWVTNG